MTASQSQRIEEGGEQSADAFKAAPCFASARAQTVDALARASSHRIYERGQTIYALGQYDGGDVVIVERGRARVSMIDAASGAMQIEELEDGAVFGLEIALADDPENFAQRLAVIAIEPTALRFVDAQAIDEAMRDDETLSIALARALANEVVRRRFRAQLVSETPMAKVSRVLLELLSGAASAHGAHVIDKLPRHRELADFAGVSEQEVAEIVAALIADGVVARRYPGLEVANLEALRERAGVA